MTKEVSGGRRRLRPVLDLHSFPGGPFASCVQFYTQKQRPKKASLSEPDFHKWLCVVPTRCGPP